MPDTEEKLLKEELVDRENVDDENEEEISFRGNFSISNYGADYNVDSLVKRMNTGAFYKPDFQREYVWSQKQASRFVESLLMGLPVPGIFVYRTEGGKHLIVDGLQRLITLQRFYAKLFASREFSLLDVREPWTNKTYATLSEEDRLRLDDSIIHTTVFKQDYPDEDSQSIYEVFERINTGGLKLSPQEIRVCVSYVEDDGTSLVSLLRRLNDDPSWRKIYGAKSVRLKDQELILRFLALKYKFESYKRPLRGFLDTFMARNKQLSLEQMKQFEADFAKTIDLAFRALGEKAFRPEKSLNAAVYDAIMIGLARRLEARPIGAEKEIGAQYQKLLADPEFIDAFKKSTADEGAMKTRVEKAVGAFDKVP